MLWGLNCVAVIRLVFVCIEFKMKSKVEMEEIHCHSNLVVEDCCFCCFYCFILELSVLQFQLQKIVICTPKKCRRKNDQQFIIIIYVNRIFIRKRIYVVNCECILCWIFTFLPNGLPIVIDEWNGKCKSNNVYIVCCVYNVQ